MMSPEVAKAAKAMAPRVRFAKLNTEEHPDAGSQHGIRGIPALLMFRGGREIARQAGAMPASGIDRWVREAGRQ